MIDKLGEIRLQKQKRALDAWHKSHPILVHTLEAWHLPIQLRHPNVQRLMLLEAQY